MSVSRSSVVQDLSIPVVAIDGEAATGKSTVTGLVAQELGYRVLYSGSLYRAVAVACARQGVDTGSETLVADLARTLLIEMGEGRVCIDGVDRTVEIDSSEAGTGASKIAGYQIVRDALLDRQLQARVLPGLVAEGRDQGELFQMAWRYFLVASADAKAGRRYRQLGGASQSLGFETIRETIIARDKADRTRPVRPLVQHPQALLIDTSDLTAAEVAGKILADMKTRSPV